MSDPLPNPDPRSNPRAESTADLGQGAAHGVLVWVLLVTVCLGVAAATFLWRSGSVRDAEVAVAEDAAVTEAGVKSVSGEAEPQMMAQGFGDIFRRSRGRKESHRDEYPRWEVEKQFRRDSFTFARIQYDSFGRARRGRAWDNDYPDCDWNFSVRLHELTAMQVDPDGVVLRLTDDSLFDYPFIFMTNVNRMALSEEEQVALRRYLLNGGFLMADDFWAPAAWRHVYEEFKQVFPDREPRELSRDHEIFHNVYEIQGKPQVPSIFAWQQGDTFEYWHGDPQGDEDPHFWGFFDDNERLMALLCHNNDIADGWEREGENKEYFQLYSERVSYPLGINIITYAMTH